ncbi:MAG: cupredoxin domain-containing protein [Pseudomonadota bacterium]
MLAALLGLSTALAVASGAETASIPAGERFIPMAAVEPKGGTTVDKEPFPSQALPIGGGYIVQKPDATGRWEVSTYRWDPTQVTVNEGDLVTLEIIGINGAEHPAVIEGYDIGFVVKRGEVTKVTFKADKPGVFKFHCGIHHPSMIGELIVLPRS